MFKSSRLRSLRQSSNTKNESEKQKQKKILSFKDPEIEKSPSEEQLQAPRRTASLENLTLDDAALSIARSVGIAFEKPGDPHRPTSRDKGFSRTKELQPKADKVNVRTDQKQARNMKDFECIEALSPTEPITMGCPVIKLNEDVLPTSEQDMWRHDQDFQKLPTVACHQIQLLNYHLEQQRQQTQTAMYQVQLLKDQLEAESAARYKAQVHNQKLMMQNKELLDHIQKLFHQVQDLEQKISTLERPGNDDDAIQREPKRGAHVESLGVTQLSQRRSSGTNSQLLSASCSTLSPRYSQVRRTSATSLQLEQETNKAVQKDSLFKSTIKDEPPSRFTGYDTDWRCRRRGSSNFSFSNDQDEKQGLTSGTANSLGENISKNRVLSTSIPEFKSSASERTVDDSQLKIGGNETFAGSTRLQIGASSGTWSRWSDIKSKAAGIDVTNTPNLASGDTFKRTEDFQRLNSKPRDSLRLFN